MAGKEGVLNKGAKFIKEKSVVIGVIGAGITLFAPEIGVPIMLWEGLQYAGANWFLNRKSRSVSGMKMEQIQMKRKSQTMKAA